MTESSKEESRRSGDGGQIPPSPGASEDDEDVPTNDEETPPYVPPHEHKLEYSYWMWFSRRPPNREIASSSEDYGQGLRLVGRMGSVEQWWGLYCHLARPAELPPLSDLHLFKMGIRPMWEDPSNINGGKWVVKLRKSQTGPAWEELCMAMLGEQFVVGEEICGIVLSIRFQEDHLALWHKTSTDTASAVRLRDSLCRVLQLPPNHAIEYKVHSDCLRASTSRQPDYDHMDNNHVDGHSSDSS